MRLDYIEVCGFRGFRDKVRVDFGGGFTVITGRNGVGKSTLCDAVEFAIIGEIGKYAVESAAKETVRDYIWWRGDNEPEKHYVTAAFVGVDGHAFSITRTREGADKTPEEIAEALCQGAVPDDPLRQLCKTSVIRDEWIAALSLDLSETQRFDLVRAALGSIEGSDLATKAKAVVAIAEAAAERVNTQYEEARSALSGGLVHLSEANDAASRSADVSAAMIVIDRFVPPAQGDLAQRLDIAQRSLPHQRRRLEGLNQAVFEGRELLAAQQQYKVPEEAARREHLHTELNAASAEFERRQRDLAEAQRAYDIEAAASEIAASLSALVEHGEAVGLHDEHCPLCAAARTRDEFEAGIAQARARIDKLAGGVNAARERLAAARGASAVAEQSLTAAQAAWAEVDREQRALREREAAQLALFEQYGLNPANAGNPAALEAEAAAEREQLIGLETALNAMEASRAVRTLSSVEARVGVLRSHADPPSVWWTPMLAFRSWRGVSDECSTPELSGFFQARGR